ncbi:MAG: polymerase alpha subunit, partial [Actinomycetia bacterium]|nr:polymerase alpha subunit [Actinomycetes bacterium]
PMSFASRDAFPARGGVGEDGGRFPLGGGRELVPGSTEPGIRPTAPYVELHAHSAYSFLDGASLPEEIAARAAELGYDAFALTDHDGVYGSLEFAHAAKHFGVRPITGAEVTLTGPGVGSTEPNHAVHVTLLCETQQGYANLCRILTDAHARTRVPGKERDLLPAATTIDMLARHAEGLVALSGCARHGLGAADPKAAARLAHAFDGAFYIELQRPYERGDARRNAQLDELARSLRVPTVATGDVHAHHIRRVRLQDVLVSIKHRTSLDGSERERRGNHESVLLSPQEMLERLPREAALRTREIADRCQFDLTQELGYRYPDFSDRVDPADVQLRQICDVAFADRYANANGHKKRARQRLDDELALISRIGLSGFFLLHWEVLELARECALEVRGPGSPRHALPPGRGRGSSVGSIVCYLTGLSHVDPVEAGLSLGRFINDEMASVPDIDLDFPRDIREKLIVRVTERYGREHAALVASFSTYRSRGAIRDVGKALGLPFAELERLARVTDGWDATRISEEIDGMPGSHTGPRWDAFRQLTREIAGLPRHISQHPGGMVISTRPLIDLVPVQPAAMAGRQICQWDKDSCGDAGFLKIDLLGLGMLSAVEDAIDRIARLRGETIDLSRIPLDDKGVYEEIQAADTVGVFQIESRAQMQSLLQTRPENLDDLTVQVALVRPGPIQGKAVHPYVKHRHAKRADPSFEPPVEHESLREPLRDTLGVVVFQDQVLDVSMAAAGFSIGEAEGLRRAMSRKRSEEAIEAWRPRFIAGAQENGIDETTAHSIYDKLCGFAGFGFPKSHAAAFALLAYQSAWLRRYYPGEFLCALMNAQPMGFYPPSSLVRDAQRRGVEVLAPHINRSEAQCGIEEEAVRVGLAYVQSVGEEDAKAIVAQQPYADLGDLARRAPVKQDTLEALVAAGACDEWGQRRQLLWRLGVTSRGESVPGGNRQLALPLEPTAVIPELPAQTPWEKMLADYKHTSLSVGVHPLQLLRPHLAASVCTSAEMATAQNGSQIEVAGMAIARQRPATANGIVFMLLEDEHGQANLIIPSKVYEEHRAIVRGEPLILARGKLERSGRNINLLVRSVVSLGPLARQAANEAEVSRDLPRAHHFGHR